MTHHAWSMPAGEAAFILNEGPDLFVGQHLAESEHGRARRTVLDHPEKLAFCAMAPKSMVLKITRRWIQLSG